MTTHHLNLYEHTVHPRALAKALQAARARLKLTQEAVAEQLGITRQTLGSWEKGERLPQPKDLQALAQLYGRTVHELLHQEHAHEPIALQLRASRRLDAALEDELEHNRAEFQELCEDYVELERLCASPLSPTQAPIYPINPDHVDLSAENAANWERNRLGLGDAPIINLRETLENEGIRIFLIDLPSRISGFYGSTPELGPCMAINRKHPPERQRWSLAHEYAHFLTNRHRADIAVFYTYRDVPVDERFADTFARSFLMPKSSVVRRYEEMKQSRNKFRPADLCLMADYYFVSVEAMYFRLEELRLVPRAMYQSLRDRGFEPEKARALLNLSAPVTDQELLPSRYRYLAAEAYWRGDLAEEAYAEFIRVPLVQARRLAQVLRTRLTQLPTGEVSELDVQLDDAHGA